MPKVSVLIATYNHARYIRETLQSVLNQSFQDFEIVVMVDGSTDDTVDVVMGVRDARIHLYEMPCNQGIAAASNAALKKCTGEYIAICDSDDLFAPHKLLRQVAYLDERPHCGTVCTHAALIDERGEPYHDESHPFYTLFRQPNRTQVEWLRHFFRFGNCICHPSALIRRGLLERVGGYDETMPQMPDFNLFVRLAALAPLYMIQQDMVWVRVRDQQANNSAYSPEKQLTCEYERTDILEGFALMPPEMALEVFGEELVKTGALARWDGTPIEPALTTYLVAMASLADDIPFYRAYGLRALKELLHDPRTKALLYERFGFTTKKYHALIGAAPIFYRDEAVRCNLYYDLGEGFRAESRVERLLGVDYEGTARPFRVSFALPEGVAATHFRFDPIEGYGCHLRLTSVRCRSVDGVWRAQPTEAAQGNGAPNGEGWTLENLDPMLLFHAEHPAVAVEICGTIALISYAELLNREAER